MAEREVTLTFYAETDGKLEFLCDYCNQLECDPVPIPRIGETVVFKDGVAEELDGTYRVKDVRHTHGNGEGSVAASVEVDVILTRQEDAKP
jgi:hypothetical protein